MKTNLQNKFLAVVESRSLRRFRSARAGALATLMLLPMTLPVSAVDIAATGSQVSPEEWNLASWAAGQWTGGSVPSTGNTYSTGAFQIRTLNSTSLDTTFGGDSLRIVAGGSLLLRNGNTNFVNGNFILDGGSLISGRTLTGGNAQDVAGNLDIASASFIDLASGGANQNRLTYQSGNFTGNSDITMSGTSETDVFQLSASMAGSHTGDWTLNGGRLVVFNDNHIGDSASVTMGGTNPNPIPTAIAATAFLDLRSGTQTIGSLSGTGGQVMGTSQTLITGGDGTTTTFGGIVVGSVSLVKEGAGTMTLSNYNSSTGSITINGGTLEFSTPAFNYNVDVFKSTQININNGSTLRINSSANNDVIPMFDGRTYTFDSTGGGSILLGTGNHNAEGSAFTVRTLGGARNTIGLITTSGENGFNLGNTTVTFDVTLGTDATSDLTVTPIISNSGSLVKNGSGRLALTGTNTYTGGTTVNDGTLAVNGSSLSDSTKLTINGGTVNLTNAERVNTLFFGAVQQNAGTYSANGNELTGLGTLIVTTGPGYAAWQSSNLTTQAGNLDHDNDGVANGIEHFLGGTGDTTGFTTPQPGVDNDMGTLSVTWVRHPDYPGFPANYGADFYVETSGTLADPWTPEQLVNGNVTITGNNVKYTFPAGTRNFARLRVLTTP